MAHIERSLGAAASAPGSVVADAIAALRLRYRLRHFILDRASLDFSLRVPMVTKRWLQFKEDDYWLWITQSWQRMRFIDRCDLPYQAGIYAIRGSFEPQHLGLSLVKRDEKLLQVEEALPNWVTEQARETRFDHAVYIGCTPISSLHQRLCPHPRLQEFERLIAAGVDLELFVWMLPRDFDNFWRDSVNLPRCESELIRHLCPLLNTERHWARDARRRA